MYFTFYGGCKPASHDEFFFLSLIFSGIPMKSTPGKFAYILHFQQSGINATSWKKCEFILKVTFSLPSPSSMLKLSKNNAKKLYYSVSHQPPRGCRATFLDSPSSLHWSLEQASVELEPLLFNLVVFLS